MTKGKERNQLLAFRFVFMRFLHFIGFVQLNICTILTSFDSLNNFIESSMKNSLKSINFGNDKNIKIIQSKAKTITDLSTHSYPQNSPYLQSPKKPDPPKQQDREKLIEQNIKLKKQVLELAEQMDQILSKEKSKKKYGINLDENMDEETKVKKLEVKKQEIRILQLKNEIFSIKKENEYVYDESSVIEKENTIRALQNEMKLLQAEKTSFLNVRKEQAKALNFLKNDEKYNEKIEKTRSQLAKIKEQCKTLTTKTAQNQKLLLKTHQKAITKSKKLKEIQQKIRENKQKMKKGNPNIVTIQMISEIQTEIMKLESQYKQSQKMWIEKINSLDIECNNRKIEEEKKLIILKDKEKEAKLNEIRIKEFKKLIMQNKLEKKMENSDLPREFRSKRNIKYLQRQNS